MKKTVILDIGAGANGLLAATLLKAIDVVDLRAITITELSDHKDLLYEIGDTKIGIGTALPVLSPRTIANTQTEELNKYCEREKAWDVIYQEAVKAGGQLEIIAVGALTNIAIAIVKRPELATLIHRVILLGGSVESGDITPFAEKNIYHDPCGAEIVFKSGIPLLMFGLNCIGVNELVFEKFEKSLPASITKHSLNYKESIPVAALLSDGFYTVKDCFVGIETKSPKTMGMTVCDLFGREGQSNNTLVALSLNDAKCMQLLKNVL